MYSMNGDVSNAALSVRLGFVRDFIDGCIAAVEGASTYTDFVFEFDHSTVYANADAW